MQYKDEKILHFNKILGKVVKQLRMEKGISANKFANEFDLSSGNYSRIENGVFCIKFITIWKIIEAHNLSFSEFAQKLKDELGEDFTLIEI